MTLLTLPDMALSPTLGSVSSTGNRSTNNLPQV
jgi:hypothetical protein